MATTADDTTPRMTQAERSALSDQKMFDAAIRLIVETGPHRATLSEIGTRAGYSRGLAAYRYKTKDVFYAALIAHLHDLWRGELERGIEGTRGLETVLAAVTALQQFVKTDPDLLRAMYKLYYHTIDHHSDITQRLRKLHASQRRQAAEWIRQCEGFDAAQHSAEDFAEQYCALVFGAIYQWLVSPDDVQLTALLERCKETLSAIAPR